MGAASRGLGVVRKSLRGLAGRRSVGGRIPKQMPGGVALGRSLHEHRMLDRNWVSWEPLRGGGDGASRLDWRFLDLRRPAARLVFEVQTTAERAMRAVWADEGFLEIHSPKIRGTANRSGRELFTLVDAAGELRECSRTKNPELFRLAVGGYGLFGVILDVDLEIVDNGAGIDPGVIAAKVACRGPIGS